MWQIALRKSAFLKTHVNVEKWTVYPPSALLPIIYTSQRRITRIENVMTWEH